APFSAVVETAQHVPAQILAGQVWQRRAGPDFAMPLDGREPIELGDVPAYLVSSARSVLDDFTSDATYHFDFPQATTLRAHVTEIGRKGGGLRIRIDGKSAANTTWPGTIKPTDVDAPISAGPHTVALDNPDGPDWVGVASLELGVDVPVLASIGQRSDSFVAL